MLQRAALFDLDGVLIDSEGLYSGFWQKKCPEYGITIPDFGNRIKGVTLPKILDLYFPKEMHDKVCEDVADFERNMKFVLFPGVMDFLRQLKKHGVPMAIVTSSGKKKMDSLFAQQPEFAAFFSAVLTDADVKNSKPHPEGYLKAAEALHTPATDCFVFEDSYNGLLAGRNSGAKVIGLATTNPAETLTDKADLVINNFTELAVDQLLSL